MKKFIVFILALLLGFLVYNPLGQAEEVVFKMVELKDNTHLYYHELLRKSLEACGHKLVIKKIPHMPQRRIAYMLDTGEVSIHWFLNSKDRNKRWVPIEVGITNKLIGQRILFIPEGAQGDYAEVDNLEEFRKLNKIGGFGKGWYDVKVWQANNLKYYEQDGEWRRLYKMVAAGNRGIDYFSRGLTEILVEAKQHPELAIEENLVFIYDRDFRFYLSYTAAHYKDVIEKAIKKAQESGLMESMVRKYWSKTFEELNYDERVKIYLKTP